MLNGLRNLFGRSKASIGSKSNHNMIVQNSKVDNLVLCTNTVDMIKTLGDMKAYDAIQKQAKDFMSAIKQTHPLYPVFSATHDNQLNALVSTPETSDAFKQYPKRIKGKYRIDYGKYPHMDKSETPWEYAYRTQTTVELETLAYQEYLGDIEDPFPMIKYVDGMKMVIGAPEFPPAVKAVISSGSVSIPFEIRRLPWMEYGQMCFGSVSGEGGLNIRIVAYKDFKKTDIRFTKEQGISLGMQLRREQLFEAMNVTKQFSIAIGGLPLLIAPISETELNTEMFRSAKPLIQYFESLMKIEERLNCTFEPIGGDILFDDYRTALILAASLDEKWHQIKTDFDNEIRFDYDRIPDNISDIESDFSQLAVAGKVLSISLQGVRFTVDRYVIIYTDARINNLASIIKNKKKRRKDILITFRPKEGCEYFYKYCRFEGIKVATA